MPRCGKGHDHPTIDAVKACYGVGVATFTTRATGGNKISQGDYPVNPRSGQQGTTLDRATAKQARYITDLLGHAKLQPVGWEPEQMTKDSASQAITELKAYLNRTGPLPRMPVAHVGEPVVAGVGRPGLATPSGEPYPDVPAGRYATKSLTGNQDLDFWRVDRPTEGRWAGRTFVKRVIGGKPDSNVRGVTAREALNAILAMGVDESRTLFGTELGFCWKCGRHLTDETSRALGIGPDCRNRM